jgi:hypothetical protein
LPSVEVEEEPALEVEAAPFEAVEDIEDELEVEAVAVEAEPEMEAPAPYLPETAELVELDWEEDTQDLTSLDGLDDLEPLAAEADLSEAPVADLSAEETISAVMASFATDDVAAEEDADEAVEDDLADGPVTASQLWRAVLAERSVGSVQDLLAAMTDFVEQLDAAGVRLGDNEDRGDSVAESDFRAQRAQRRQARLARQRRG